MGGQNVWIPKENEIPEATGTKGAALLHASWSSVWEARTFGLPSENEVPEATGSKGRSTFPG